MILILENKNSYLINILSEYVDFENPINFVIFSAPAPKIT